MNKYLYKIKDLEIPTHLKYWFARKSKNNFDLSEILNGTSFDLTDTVNKKLHLINIFGNSIQNGEPTPENPINIKSTGDNGSITEKITNKNLFNKGNINSFNTYVGTVSHAISANVNEKFRTIYVKLINGKTYTVSKGFGGSLILGTTEDVPTLGMTLNNFSNFSNLTDGKYGTITLSGNDKYLVAYIYSSGDYDHGLDIQEIYDTLQIEENTVATTYLEHQEQIYTIPCQQPMRSIGNVKDTFVKVDRVWYERHIIEKGVLGTENYRVATYWEAPDKLTADNYNTAFFGILVPHTVLNSVFLCNRFEYTGENYWGTDKEGLQLTTADNKFGMRIAKNKLDGYDNDLNNTQKCRLLSDYLNNNLTEVLYSRVEPLDLPCTQAQITALEALMKARTYKNITHIYSEDEVPANLEIQYYKEKGE